MLVLRCLNKSIQIQWNNVMSYEERRYINRNEELFFLQVLRHMDRTIADLLPLLSDPRIERFGDGNIVRFLEKDSQHAIVLKLVQLTSNLRAGWLLINHGFVYEWSVIQRLLDETIENIHVFFYENQADNQSTLHERLLNEFYTEDLDDKGNLRGERIASVPRGEIREFVSGSHKDINKRRRKEMPLLNKENVRGLYHYGSGYIHGRAAPIMSLYDRKRNQFRTDGLDDEGRLCLARKDFWLLVSMAIIFSILIGEKWEMDEEYLSNARILFESLKQITGWVD